jgi:hypothetical protein
MSNAMELTLTAEEIEAFVATRDAERAVTEQVAAEQAATEPTGPASTMPPVMPLRLPPQLPKPLAKNFIARHWRGEFSLPRAFWVNHLLLGIAVGLALGAMAVAINLHAVEQPIRWLISLGLTWTVSILFSVWAAIGVWRAATAYRRAGKRFWGVTAKVTMALGALHLCYTLLFVAIPQGAGFYEIVAGDAGMGAHQFKVLNNGTMLDFSGGISFGTAKEFELMLKSMDNVRTVRLNSNGGRIAEAQKISDLIRARGLSTYVSQHCVSACTVIFLGGKQRALNAQAKLGFHQPTFKGMTTFEQRAAIARERARLQNFGLSKDFAERANLAAPSGMWYPEQGELLREHVVTSIYTPPPAKPVASTAPAKSASATATRGMGPVSATQAAYEGMPK